MGSNNNSKGDAVANIQVGVPIIGQEVKEYWIGGMRLGFQVDPDDVSKMFVAAVGGGQKIPELFVMQWQRCSMNFAFDNERIAKLEGELEELRGQVEQLRSVTH